MSDPAEQAFSTREAERLGAAIARWSSLPDTAAIVASPDALLLVLDADANRILHAAPAAASLRRAISDGGGRLLPSLGLSDQIGRLGPLSARPRLARLRLDPRRLAPPVTCHVARVALEDGASAIALVPLALPSGLRPPSHETSTTEASMPEASSINAAVHPDAAEQSPRRFTWRSDGSSLLSQVSDTDADIRSALEGRSWPVLLAQAAAGSQDAVAALSERRTFRGLKLVLDLPGSSEAVEIALSGTPAARPDQGFAGFSGYGVIRARRPRRTGATSQPAGTAPEESAFATPDSPVAAGAASGATDPGAGQAAGATPAEVQPVPDRPAQPERGSSGQHDLSTNEHAAFREIARALGARYAGDEEPSEAGAATGAVMPFPAPGPSVPGGAARAFDDAVARALDRLPIGVLIRRGGTIRFANRRLLDRTGMRDAQALEAAGAFACLSGPAEASERLVIRTASGRSATMLVEKAEIDWEGAAELLLLREPMGDVEDPHGVRDVLERLAEGVVTLDADGRVLTLNAGAAALFAEQRCPLVGEPFADLFTPESAAVVAESLRQAREAKASEPREIARRGHPKPPPLRLRIVRLSATGNSAYCATLEGLPVRQAADEPTDPRRQAEAASQRKLDYFARASHEIRAPLGRILSAAETMLAERFGPLGNEQYRDGLRDIRGAGEQALSFLSDLVDLARLESGRIDLDFADIPLNELVSGCIALMQPRAARDRIIVRTSLSPDLKTLTADERSMRQATLNVIANAIRFTAPGGQVIVSTTVADHGEIALRIRDTGVGMTPEEVEHTLDPFQRTSLPGDIGSGLGLTLSKALVEANRGRFRLTSRKNEGTLVEMVFPSARASRAATAISP